MSEPQPANPYAPPLPGASGPVPQSAGEPQAPARGGFPAAGALLAILIATGVVLRIGALSPAGLLGVRPYDLFFFAHESVAVILLVALGVAIVVRSGLSISFLAGGLLWGWGLWRAQDRSSWLVLLPALLALEEPHLGPPLPASTRWRWAGAQRGLRWGVAFYFVVRCVALDMAAVPVMSSSRMLWALLLLPVEVGAGLFVAVQTARLAAVEASAWQRSISNIIALLFAQGVLLNVPVEFLRVDVHLRDTLFPVAGMHFMALVVLFALLRPLQQASRSVLGWLGLALAAISAEVFCLLLVRLGVHGMPRGYIQYLDVFIPMQLEASVASFACALGCVLIVAAWLRGVQTQTATSS